MSTYKVSQISAALISVRVGAVPVIAQINHSANNLHGQQPVASGSHVAS